MDQHARGHSVYLLDHTSVGRAKPDGYGGVCAVENDDAGGRAGGVHGARDYGVVSPGEIEYVVAWDPPDWGRGA